MLSLRETMNSGDHDARSGIETAGHVDANCVLGKIDFLQRNGAAAGQQALTGGATTLISAIATGRAPANAAAPAGNRRSLGILGAGSSDGRIARTEARDGLWQAQTPQMFRIGMLRTAILRAQADGHDLTDEASAIEWLGHAPKLVQGNLRNFKVTYPEDFDLAEAILSRPSSAS